MMNYQMAEKHTKKPGYQRPITVLFLLQLLPLVKFSLFCVVVFLWRSDEVCWTGDQLALLHSVFISSSFASFWLIPYKRYPVLAFLWTPYCIIYFCVSLQPPSMSEGPLFSCSWFPDALFIVRKASPETLLAELGGSDWLVISFMGGEAE